MVWKTILKSIEGIADADFCRVIRSDGETVAGNQIQWYFGA
jgi:hypothetical protein